jgi:hypothetical protein
MKAEELIRAAVLAASANIGSQRLLANAFGLGGPAVSLWLMRGSFPKRYAVTIANLAGEGYEVEKLKAALREIRQARQLEREARGA